MSNIAQFPPRAARSERSNQFKAGAIDQKRWCAELIYKDGGGGGGGSWNVVTFEEIADLHDIIERGPDWNTMVSCTIRLNKERGRASTGEER